MKNFFTLIVLIFLTPTTLIGQDKSVKPTYRPDSINIKVDQDTSFQVRSSSVPIIIKNEIKGDQKKTVSDIESKKFISSFVLSLITFGMGYFLSTFTRKNIELKRLKSIQNFIFTWLDLVKKPIEKQIEELENFLKGIKNLKNLAGVKLIKINLHIKQLKNISDADYLKSLVFSKREKADKLSSNKIDEFFRLTTNIYFLEDNDNLILERYKKFNEDIDQLREKWNKSLNLLHELYNESDREGTYDSLFFQIIEIYNKWEELISDNEEFKNDIYHTKQVLIDKIYGVCDEIYKRNSTDDFVKKFMNVCEELEIIFKQYELYKEAYSQLFQELKDNIKKGLESIEEAKKELEKYKFKWLYRID